jgi:hypothetical protein
MKRLLIRISTAVLTFALGVVAVSALVRTCACRPPQPQPPVVDGPKGEKTLEMVFVLDTTGSMGGLIEGAKQRVWGIINEVMQTPAHPNVRVGLVAYRDHGDQYVTQVLPLTNDLDKVYTTLMEYRADGGGDGPEDVRRALADGVRKAGWSQPQADTAQIVFLVGDAPPHDDYRQEPDTLDTAAEAIKSRPSPRPTTRASPNSAPDSARPTSPTAAARAPTASASATRRWRVRSGPSRPSPAPPPPPRRPTAPSTRRSTATPTSATCSSPLRTAPSSSTT